MKKVKLVPTLLSATLLLQRQGPNRSTFLAGQNLPDKEFRYLRTVIVTAAVHWGFGALLPRAIHSSPYPASTGQVSPHILRLAALHRAVF